VKEANYEEAVDRKDNTSRMVAKLVLRHILPIGLTTLCMVILWMLVTLPIVAVFILDDAFVPSEYARFLAYAFGIAFGLSTLVLFPLALLGESLTKRSKDTIWGFPVSLFSCAVMTVIVRFSVLESFRAAILSWSGVALLISVLFVLYWGVLWNEETMLARWQKPRQPEGG
jgi:hypothetical protein